MTDFEREEIKANLSALYNAVFNTIIGSLELENLGEIYYANHNAERLFRYYTLNALEGENIEILVPERFRDGHRHGVEMFRQNPVPRIAGRDTPLWGIKKDGEEFPVEIFLSSGKIEGRTCFMANIFDISKKSERKTT